MAYTQAERPISIATPLGEDVLLLESFSGTEAVSHPFRFHVTMASEQSALSIDDLLRQPVTVIMKGPDDQNRYFNGLVTRAVQLERSYGLTSYEAEFAPKLWFLSLTSNIRIFQHKTVKDIIEKIFQEHDLTDYRFDLYGAYPEREYCVQYRESDLNFVSRLMEDEGIFYFFDHTQDKHMLVLTDSPAGVKPCPLQKSARYGIHPAAMLEEDLVHSLLEEYQVYSGKIALTDYNFEKPKTRLDVSLTDKFKSEVYDYPGKYETRDEGDRYAKIRLEEREVKALTVAGTGDCRGFVPGFRFDLENHYRRDTNQTYMLLSLTHNAGGIDYRREGQVAYSYGNSFTAMPHKSPFRPPRVTPKPFVRGPQTAVVTGPSGEEIYVDKYGRVKVQFHWDREGKYNENSSCWVRVSQAWAGKGWGAMIIPRIDQEVIVDFLEGDPDRPLITGRVYNADQTPPYSLPGEHTKSTLKSYSSKGGGGFNEIRFEDKKGSEQIFLNAQKNQDVRVKKDNFETIGEERHLIVGTDQLEQVKGDKHAHVTGDHNEKVDGTVSLKAGQDVQHKAGIKYAMDAGTEIHLKAGVNLVIESGASLTLKVGGNFVNLNPGGVFISGTMVMINSGGAAGSGAGSNPQPPKDPKEADTAIPGEASQLPPLPTPPVPEHYSLAALVFKSAAQSGAPFCDI